MHRKHRIAMRNITFSQLAGITPLFLALAAFLAASATGALNEAQQPLLQSFAGLVLIAGASIWLGAFGLLLASIGMTAISLAVPQGVLSTQAALYAVPAMAGWLGMVTLIARRSLIGYRKRKSINLGHQVEKLRERVHELETLGFAGGMAEILGAASDAWSKEIQRVIDSGSALLNSMPKEIAGSRVGKSFEEAIAHAQEGLAAQSVLTSQLKLEADREATLADIVNQAIQLADEKLKLRGVEVKTELEDSGPPFAVDLQLATIALRNLIENAAEASGRGGDITVRAVSSYRGERGVIEVVDKGSGLSQSVVPHIFKPFFSTRQGQLGLGLSVAREIAARMGGSISMSANEPRGLTFRLRVSMRRADVVGSTLERQDALKDRGANTRFSSGEYKDSLEHREEDTQDFAQQAEADAAAAPASLQEDTKRREREEEASASDSSAALASAGGDPELAAAARETTASTGVDATDPAGLASTEKAASDLPPPIDDAFRSALKQAKAKREEQERAEFRARVAEAEKRLAAEKAEGQAQAGTPAPKREEMTE